jgi:pyruvate formate lyase activating enzyme
MREAMLYDRLEGGKVRCRLCAHGCLIKDGSTGICRVRRNEGGTLRSLVYGRLISTAVDPIEKKPLFHFLPGSRTLSIATVGCNLRCEHCQNWEISQFPRERPGEGMPGQESTPEAIVEAAERHESGTISYTYTEPTISMEFNAECMKLAHERGIRNAFVSNGFMSEESARLAASLLDANNIDIKGDDRFYRDHCGARLDPVLRTVRIMKEAGVWVETTTLVIPGMNDSDEILGGIARFIAEVDPEMPWHVTRFHPAYRMAHVPSTPMESLGRAARIGREAGLKHVFEGNAPGEGGEDTRCPGCGQTVIKRLGFSVVANRLAGGRCPACGTSIAGVWA